MRYLVRLEIHPFRWYFYPLYEKDEDGGEIKLLIFTLTYGYR